jgi:hypothetical protein
MNALREWICRLLRGPHATRLLERLGVDPRRYWLLIDLFGELSDRGEMLDQLGQNGVALDVATKIYAAVSLLFTLFLVIAHPPLTVYFTSLLMLMTFLLTTVLVSETGNSLVNPAEGLILAHQPINGATYTAAKLTHLARIVLYLTPALNLVPALGGLALQDAHWTYPILHLTTAFALAVVAALLCCALYGWLLRFVPAKRLKAAGQLASAFGFLGIIWMQNLKTLITRLDLPGRLPSAPAARWTVGLCIAASAIAVVALGIRSLSADYLIRVSGMMRGGASGGSGARRSHLGTLVQRFFGGQPGRAGFAFVSRMMLRDWQFRRQVLPALLPIFISFGSAFKSGWPADPFSRSFAPIHLLPHGIAFLLFLVCATLPYGADYKGAWVFLLAPASATRGFASGVHALFWLEIIVIPHLLLLPMFVWRWGLGHAALFAVYSVAAGSIYLAMELRLIEVIPFSRQMDPTRNSVIMPVMIFGGMAMAVAIGLQYLMFSWPALVGAVTAALAIGGYFLTRASVAAFAASIRFNLGIASEESGTLYKEIVA